MKLFGPCFLFAVLGCNGTTSAPGTIQPDQNSPDWYVQLPENVGPFSLSTIDNSVVYRRTDTRALQIALVASRPAQTKPLFPSELLERDPVPPLTVPRGRPPLLIVKSKGHDAIENQSPRKRLAPPVVEAGTESQEIFKRKDARVRGAMTVVAFDHYVKKTELFGTAVVPELYMPDVTPAIISKFIRDKIDMIGSIPIDESLCEIYQVRYSFFAGRLTQETDMEKFTGEEPVAPEIRAAALVNGNAALWAAGLIHGDISDRNIFTTKDRAALGDFGIMYRHVNQREQASKTDTPENEFPDGTIHQRRAARETGELLLQYLKGRPMEAMISQITGDFVRGTPKTWAHYEAELVRPSGRSISKLTGRSIREARAAAAGSESLQVFDPL